MICDNEIPDSFYIQKYVEFMNSDQEKTIENFKIFSGASDERIEVLKLKLNGFNL